MKKVITLTLMALLVFMLSGCNLFGATDEILEIPVESGNEEPSAEAPVEEPRDNPEAPEGSEQTEPWYRQKIEVDLVGEDGQLKPWYTEKHTPYIEILEDRSAKFKTIYHEDVREIIAVLKELFRQTNNLQTKTEEEVRAPLTEKYLQDQYEMRGEPFYEWYVREARENGWVAKTEDEVIDYIAFSPDGCATVDMSWTLTFLQGTNLDEIGYELNKPMRERAEVRFKVEDGEWKVYWIKGLGSKAK